MTMMPMPPSQLSAWRQITTERGSVSRPESTVAPVVDRPDMVSKKACVNDKPGSTISSGTVASDASATQVSVTSR